jgi:mono/diheme cytochrome c family protein
MGSTCSLRKLLPALLGLIAVTAGCRLDMHIQPYYRPFAKSDFFADDRSARMPVEGTVARGDLREDTYFYTGKINGNPGDYMPFPVTAEVLARGRERFNITCTPCHGRVGDGLGFIPTRGYKQPPSFHIDRLRQAPIGYFFDVDTNGFGVMPDYAAQVAPRDRWCIAAYIRALQLSQNATLADVPHGQEIPSRAPEFIEPGTGATLPQAAPAKSGKGGSE